MGTTRNRASILGNVSALAAAVSSVLTLSPTTAPAVTRTVTNCSDSGTGSLRAAVAAAGDSDTIDMTGLACSTISLHSGITVPQNNLTLKGPGQNQLNIQAKYGTFPDIHQVYDRVFNHTGTGWLELDDLRVRNGYVTGSGNALGGCIKSAGSVELRHSTVTACRAVTSGSNSHALGGGVYASGDLYMKYSTIGGNSLTPNIADGGTGGGDSRGGGLYAKGQATVKYSTVSFNTAKGGTGLIDSIGGGLTIAKGGKVSESTISNNLSYGSVGGIHAYSRQGTQHNYTLKISDSTISGNTASNGIIGGVYANTGTVHLYNSTIAHNSAAAGTSGSFSFTAAGLALGAYSTSMKVLIRSSILAQNYYGSGSESDLSVMINPSIAIAGSHNLVRVNKAITGPAGITGACPLLGPLRDNGGLTLTHALMSGSPAIDAGDNTASFNYDQRGGASYNGTVDYPRVSNGTADIGAYEVQQDDELFDAGFEGCAALPP